MFLVTKLAKFISLVYKPKTGNIQRDFINTMYKMPVKNVLAETDLKSSVSKSASMRLLSAYLGRSKRLFYTEKCTLLIFKQTEYNYLS